jgi:MFS family permease
MFETVYRNYIQPIRTFQRDARLFLWMTVINGIILSGWQLFFNIYMLQSGYSREFLGLINSLPSLTGLLLGIPMGRFSDRVGRKPALIVSILCSGLAMLGQITFRQQAVIAVMAGLTGIFNMLFLVSLSPLMMKLSEEQNRTLLFSLNYGLQTLAGAVGSLFAGQLPSVFGVLLHASSTSAIAYRWVLATNILLGITSLIPLWMMKEPKTPQTPLTPQARPGGLDRTLTRLILKLASPNFLIGIGAAILIPYMNVFFKDRFHISDSLLGILFSLSALFIGVGSLIGPRLTLQLGGKIRTVVFTQLASVVFMLMVGFIPSLWIAGVSVLMRGALMNMATPLYSAFCMEQTPAPQQGFVSSVLNIAWQIGWSVGPYISGIVQVRYGFTPLFLATTVLYLLAIGTTWLFFRSSEKPELASQIATV